MKTKIIAGQEITLEAGKRYLAIAPIVYRDDEHHPVTIYDDNENNVDKFLIMFGFNFTKEEANNAIGELYAGGRVDRFYFIW